MVQEDFIVSKKIFWAVPGMRSKNISVKAGKQLSMSASKCLDFSLLSTFFTPCLHKWAPKVRKKKKKVISTGRSATEVLNPRGEFTVQKKKGFSSGRRVCGVQSLSTTLYFQTTGNILLPSSSSKFFLTKETCYSVQSLL